MGEKLNPFGIRNGEIITIGDVPESEKGLKCNCVCPNCGGVFQARMGNVREWHFAHTKDGCDSEIAFLRGLYMLLKRYIDEKNAIPLPSITLYATLGETEEINKENCLNYVTIQKTYSCNYKQPVRTAKRCTFISCEIVNCDEKSIYLLAKTKKKKLAIIIEPPKISCNGLKRSDIDEDVCLKLNLKSIDYQELTKLETVFSLFNNEAYYKWDKNITTIYKYLDDIAKANRDFVKEKEEQERRLRKQKEQRKKGKQRQKSIVDDLHKSKKRINSIAERLKPLEMLKEKFYQAKEYNDSDFSIDGLLAFEIFLTEIKHLDNYAIGLLEAECVFEKTQSFPIYDHWQNEWKKCSVCDKLVRCDCCFMDEDKVLCEKCSVC